MTQKLPVLIRIYLNNKLVDVKQSTDAQVVIGSSPEATIQLSNEQVSPIHCLIEERDDAYFISDLGSSLGTFKNGEVVLDNKIESGDELLVGPYKLEFFIGIPKPKSAPAAVQTSTPVPSESKTVEDLKSKLSLAVTDEGPEIPSDVPVSEARPPHGPPSTEKKNSSVHAEAPKTPKKPSVKSKIPVSSEPLAKPDIKSAKVRTDIPTESEVTEFGQNTFSPKSEHKDLTEIVSPSEGNIVEVVVAWRERVISTYQFKKKSEITFGTSLNCDVKSPVILGSEPYKLVTIQGKLVVHVPSSAGGWVVSSKGKKAIAEIRTQSKSVSGKLDIALHQGEMIQLTLDGGNIQVAIRYSKLTKKVIAAPILDLTASEKVSLLATGAMSLVFALFMLLSSHQVDEEKKVEDKVRLAVVNLNAPKLPPPAPMKVEPVPKSQPPKQIKKSDKPKTKVDEGKAGSVAKPKKPVKRKPKKGLVASRPGGSKKTTNKKAGSSVKSKRPDPSKSGLLGALGGGGIMETIDQATSGSGELTGLADQSTGQSGFDEDRAGTGIGSKIKNTGATGAGASSVGVDRIGTKGQGRGIVGRGKGGIGEKGRVNVSLAGEEAFFEGSVDRDAVKRVILQNKRSIRYCYMQSLNKDSNLAGQVVLRWTVVERGRVAKISTTKNSTGSRALASCLMRRIKGFRFPEPPQDQVYEVGYPFLFEGI